MNKMELLKNVFELIGFKTKIEPYYGEYILFIKGTQDSEGVCYEFTFNKDFEPTLFDCDIKENILLKDYYEKFEKTIDK